MQSIASISMDLDNQWSYMKTHGDSGWEEFPTYLDEIIPYTINLLEKMGHQITFFVVGRDATDCRNHEALTLIKEHGHEVGNHSYEHEPWLHLYSRDAIRCEIHRTNELLRDATGMEPVGFRGPGYCSSVDILEILLDHGYQFDASSLPTFVGPLARIFYFWTSSFTREERKKRELLFGRFEDGFRPIRPYLVRVPSGRTILEIPVTTFPVLRTPFHLSYLLYLSRFSLGLMETYLDTALKLCCLTGTEPSFLLHPLDLLGGDRLPELGFFPGMDLSSETKTQLFVKVLRRIAKTYRIVPMGEHARLLKGRIQELKVRRWQEEQ